MTLEWLIERLKIEGLNTKQEVLQKLQNANLTELHVLRNSVNEKIRVKNSDCNDQTAGYSTDYLYMDADHVKRKCAKMGDTFAALCYKSDANNRDVAFLKELSTMLELVHAPCFVLVRDGEVNPGYALEKLNTASLYLKSVLDHFEKKLNLERGE